MCLSRLVCIETVEADGSRAIGVSEGRTVSVSLAVLAFEDELPVPGDWVQVTTGLAVRRLTGEEAAAILQARTDLEHGLIAESTILTESTKVQS